MFPNSSFKYFSILPSLSWAFQVVLVVKTVSANAGDIRDVSLIPGSERSPEGGQGNPLLYSCLKNPMDRRAWWAIIHGAAKSWTALKRLSTAQHKLGEDVRVLCTGI